MNPDPPMAEPEDDAASILRHSRIVALAIAILYPLLRFQSPPGSTDPLLGRLTISGVMLAIITATYLSPWISHHSRMVLSFGLWVVSAHYFGLAVLNPTSTGHITGIIALIIVVSSLQHPRLLLPYLGFVLFLATALPLITDPNLLDPLLPMTLSASALAIITVGGLTRLVAQLNASQHSLERRVDERTAELSTANASLTEQLRCSTALNEITEQISTNDSPEPILFGLARTAGEALDADHALILFLPAGDERASVVSQWRPVGGRVDPEKVRSFLLLSFPSTIAKLSRGPELIESYANHPAEVFVRDGIDSALHVEHRVKSMLCISFGHHEEGCYLGLITYLRGDRVWSRTAVAFLRSAAHHVQIALQKMKLIEEWRRTQEALLESEAQLRQAQKMEAMGRLAGGIAHDFNNLLTAIRGYTALVEGELDGDSPLLRDVKEIRYASDRAVALVEQLLAFSRQERQRRKVVELNALASQMKQMLHRVLDQDINLVFELADVNTHILADPGQLEQVVLNLTVNACDAMPEGGWLTLRTSTLPAADASPLSTPGTTGQLVRLEVIDNGCGMDEATAARIFEPFFTTKEVGKGTGLGLSMVYGIVQQNHGEIRVESHPDRGSRFIIDFPQVQEVAPPALVEDETALYGGPETILLVEDDEAVRRLTSRILRRSGYAVLEADSGKVALEIFHELGEEIDLLLSDVIMPEMNGPELAAHLLEQRPALPVLFISGYADAKFRRGANIPPESVVVPKPFSPEALTRAVRSSLGTDEEGGKPPAASPPS